LEGNSKITFKAVPGLEICTVRRDPVGRPTTSVVNRGENGRGMPLPYKNANNAIMIDVPLCLYVNLLV